MLCLFVGFRIVYDSPCIIEVMRSTWNAPQTIHLAEIECGRRKKWINERITRLENPTIVIYHIVTIPSHNWICTLQRTLRINLHNHLFAFPRFFPRMTPKCVVAGSESRLPLQQPCKGDASSRWFNCPGRGVFPKDIGRVPLPSVCWFELAWWSCPISCSPACKRVPQAVSATAIFSRCAGFCWGAGADGGGDDKPRPYITSVPATNTSRPIAYLPIIYSIKSKSTRSRNPRQTKGERNKRIMVDRWEEMVGRLLSFFLQGETQTRLPSLRDAVGVNWKNGVRACARFPLV